MINTLRFAVYLLALTFAAAPAASQHHLFGEDARAYVGPVVKLSDINGASGFLMGGRIGLTKDTSREAGLRAGVAVYGLMNRVRVDARDDVRFVYGGIDLEHVWRTADPLHFSAMTLIGAGTADTDAADQRQYAHMRAGGPALFAVEHGVGVALNLAPMLQLGGGVSYRAVAGTTGSSLRNADLIGWTGQLALTFGRH